MIGSSRRAAGFIGALWMLQLLAGCGASPPPSAEPARAAEPLPAEYNRRIPSLSQHDPRYIGDGDAFCGPTSAAIVVDYLANHGYDRLPANDPVTLVNTLAERMDTLRSGTSSGKLITVLSNYFQAQGYSVDFQVDGHDPYHRGFFKAPDLERARHDVMRSNKFIFVVVGYYRSNGKDLVRAGGHYMVMEGFRNDAVIVANPGSGRISNLQLERPAGGGTLTAGGSHGNLSAFYSVKNLGKPDLTTVLDCLITMTLD